MRVSRAWSNLAAPDHILMHRMNRWMAPAWVRWWMVAATRAGDGWLWLAYCVVLLLSKDPARHRALLAAASSTLIGVLLFRRLKIAVGRRRPCELQPHCWAKLLPPDQFSFPSGHTITAFAVAIPLSHFYPAAAFGLLFIASNVAISRVVLGMHFLSDVVAGALIGGGLGYATVWVVTALPW
ncbi:MAG TPA: phosphatase PAP2 family protein [Bryobacteraceae bacterium]|nr:phosphatase PAP2 family protein [Bryobacteraceae bacterium]